MSELGDVLELLHTSFSLWRTLRAVGYKWTDGALETEAFLRRTQPGDHSWRVIGPGMVGGGHSRIVTLESNPDQAEDDSEDDNEEVWRLWIEQPEHRRAEFGTGQETGTAVWAGNTWWSWTSGQEVTTNAGDTNYQHGKGPSERLVEPSGLLGSLEIELLGREVILGRPVFSVRGSPTGLCQLFLHGLGSGADEYILLVDAERGVILRSEARLENRPFTIIAMTEVAFDRPLPAETFLVPGQHAGS